MVTGREMLLDGRQVRAF